MNLRPAVLLSIAAAVAAGQKPPQIAGCDVFPADNIWNVPVDRLPVAANSAALVESIGAATVLHPDFGTIYGIPYAVVAGTQQSPSYPTFLYADESERGPYPIPTNPPIERGDDRHILLLDRETCVLYELYDAEKQSNGTWRAGSGAIFDLKSNKLRPDTWTSADAAGLPILPGLVRYEEAASGEIRHALRFTVQKSRSSYVWPATHEASSDDDGRLPRMGERFRLRADFNISGFSKEAATILRALQKYGMIVADNGSNWFVSGATDPHWDNYGIADEFKRVHGYDFEAVDTSSLRAQAGFATVRPTAWAPPVVNAASYRAGPVAPGELISVFGTNLGPAGGVPLQLDGDGQVATLLGGTEVRFDGVPAPVIYSSSNQVNAVVPFGVASKATTTLEVLYGGAAAYTATLDVLPVAPGILARDASGSGRGAILNQVGSVISENSPAQKAQRGSYILIFAVGGGQTVPAGVDGQLSGTNPSRLDVSRVSVRVGGVPATVEYAGGANGLVAGVLQVNAKLAANTPVGDAVPILLTLDGLNSQPGVTVAVR